jgi:hypothetical protein
MAKTNATFIPCAQPTPIPFLYRAAAATLSLAGRVAIVRLTGALDAESLPWLRSDVRRAGKKLGAEGFLFDVLVAHLDIDSSALSAHAEAEDISRCLEPIAWLLPAAKVDLFRDYTLTAAHLGLVRGAFGELGTGYQQPRDPVGWASRHACAMGKDDAWSKRGGAP